MARIAGGVLKGLPIQIPARVRATGEKIRQALFNILGDSIVRARVLDGFAGSGAFGLEALSRGASEVVFLERDVACVRAIQQNLDRIPPGQISGQGRLVRGDALAGLRRLARRGERFELIVLDPPYEGDWGKKALNRVGECVILARSGLLCLEHARRVPVPPEAGSLTLMKQHRYGDTVLSFYHADTRGLPRHL